MPSGGGGFGGGGGGGGGFSGGGYHGSSGSGGGGGGPGTIIIASVTTIIVVMIVLMVRFTSNVNLSEDTFYSPGDTRLIELNTLFCRKITLSESSFFTDADLFLLTNEEIPSITDRNNFTITGEYVIGNNEFQFWQYHLYRNSNITISACIPSTQSGTSRVQGVSLFVVKGNGNYESWKVDGSSSHAYYHSVVDRVCNHTNSSDAGLNTITNITINDEDEWYVAFAIFDADLGNVSVELFFERFQYTTESLANISETCSTSSDGDCSLDVGFRSDRKYGLIVTTIPDIDDIDWEENVDVDWSCSRNHGGYFLVIGVPIFGLIIIIVLIICGIICGFCVYDSLDNIKSCCRRLTPSGNTRRPVLPVAMTSFTADPSVKESSDEPNDVPEEVLRMQAGEDGPSPYTTDSSNPPPYDAKHNYF